MRLVRLPALTDWASDCLADGAGLREISRSVESAVRGAAGKQAPKVHREARDYFGGAMALPMSRTTFQVPSFCSFQMLVYFPYSTMGLPALSLEWNSKVP